MGKASACPRLRNGPTFQTFFTANSWRNGQLDIKLLAIVAENVDKLCLYAQDRNYRINNPSTRAGDVGWYAYKRFWTTSMYASGGLFYSTLLHNTCHSLIHSLIHVVPKQMCLSSKWCFVSVGLSCLNKSRIVSAIKLETF